MSGYHDLAKQTKVAKQVTVDVGIATVAGATETEVPVFQAPAPGRIVSVGFVPKAAITGANTNYMTLGFKNKGSGGTGTTVIASKAYTLGINVAAFDFEELPLTAVVNLAKGDVLSFYKAKTGTGMDMPDLIASVVFEYA